MRTVRGARDLKMLQGKTLRRSDGTRLQFDGLWDLLPLGDGVYFTAGIADEEHGLFGIITED